MMDNSYKEAKLEKLKQLKKLMYELMASEGGDTPLDVDSIMEGPAPDVEEELELAEEEMPEGEEPEEEALSELQKMKRDYFKPKVRERRPGTAVILGSSKEKKPLFEKTSMMDSKTSPMKPYSKKGRY